MFATSTRSGIRVTLRIPYSPASIHNTRLCIILGGSVILFKYNRQDAKLYNILYYCQCCTRFGR